MSPRGRSRERSSHSSPRKVSARSTLPDISNPFSELVSMLDYEPYTNELLSAVPEREWRLIAALLRKREKDEYREMVAAQFHRMWEREKTEREMGEAESSEHYHRYIHWKRAQEREYQDMRQLEKVAEQRLHEDHLIQYIREKDMKTAELLANEYDRKASDLVEKSIQETARQYLAADRRSQHSAAQESKRQLELVSTMLRVDNARQRRRKWLKDTSQRLAIENALSSWESKVVRQEVTALESARRAQHALHAALTDARGEKILRAREARNRRARDIAALCAQLREVARFPSGSRRRHRSQL